MSQLWVQANTYSKFILLLALIYPVCMMILAWKIERLFPDKKKPQMAATK